jgi:hypothetical protein
MFVALGPILVQYWRPALDIRSMFVYVSEGLALLDNDCQYRHLLVQSVCSGRCFFGIAFCMSLGVLAISQFPVELKICPA